MCIRDRRPIPLRVAEGPDRYRSGFESQRPESHRDADTGQENGADAELPPLGYALAQLQGVYILAQTADGLVIVDMHAAHERIGYERLKRSWEEGAIRGQPLLVPVMVRVAPWEADLAESNLELFRHLGMGLDLSLIHI